MIFVVHTSDEKNIKTKQGLPWIALACSQQVQEVCCNLSKDDYKSIAKDIELIADEHRQYFVDYIGRMASEQEDQVLWYAARFASKSMSQTTIFHQFVYLKLLEKYSQHKEDLLVVTDNRELLYNLEKIKMTGVSLLGRHLGQILNWRIRVRGCLKIVRYFISWCIFRIFKNKKIDAYDCFIHTWLNNRCFQDMPQFYDSYLGRLDGFLLNKGYQVARLSPISFSLKYLIKTRNSNFIYPLSYLKIKDLGKIFLSQYSIQYTKNDLVVDQLVENEIKKENATKIYLDYLIYYYSYKGMKPYIQEKCSFFYPYENQPWEKMLNLAFYNKKRIAYLFAMIPYNWLDYYTSDYEVNEPRPDIVLTSGKKWTEFLRNINHHLNIEEAGTIRYAYLFEKQEQRPSQNTKKIVVALPLHNAAAVYLQKQIMILAESSFGQNYQWCIKSHPHLKERFLMKKFFKKIQNISVSYEDLNKLILQADLFITSDSTSVFESILSGVKTLYFIPDELTYGFQHFVKNHSYIAYNDDFSEQCQKALNSTVCPSVSVEKFFSQPEYDIFEAMI